jgi:hypothetical protein
VFYASAADFAKPLVHNVTSATEIRRRIEAAPIVDMEQHRKQTGSLEHPQWLTVARQNIEDRALVIAAMALRAAGEELAPEVSKFADDYVRTNLRYDSQQISSHGGPRRDGGPSL